MPGTRSSGPFLGGSCSGRWGWFLVFVHPGSASPWFTKGTVLVGWFATWLLFSISYMGCHPSHWRTPSFFKMVTTNQSILANKIVLYMCMLVFVSLGLKNPLMTSRYPWHLVIFSCIFVFFMFFWAWDIFLYFFVWLNYLRISFASTMADLEYPLQP